jgi:hypothetical protein
VKFLAPFFPYIHMTQNIDFHETALRTHGTSRCTRDIFVVFFYILKCVQNLFEKQEVYALDAETP